MPLNNNDLNINTFVTDIIRPYLYEQYKNIEGMEGFFNAIADFIQEEYFNKMLFYWSQRDLKRSKYPYLTFYVEHYLGIKRPVNVDTGDVDTEDPYDSVKNIYDTRVFYDARFIYDDFYESKGFMSTADFLAFLAFLYDYSELVWTHDYIIMFIAKVCNMQPIDIKIRYTPTCVEYRILGTKKGRDFISSMNAMAQQDLPICNNFKFMLGDHVSYENSRTNLQLIYNRPDTWTHVEFEESKKKKSKVRKTKK